MCFLPDERERARVARAAGSKKSSKPRASRSSAGATCRSTAPTSARPRWLPRPYIKQLFIGAGEAVAGDQDAFERKLYVVRRVFELEAGDDAPSSRCRRARSSTRGCSPRRSCRGYFPDLRDPRVRASARARPLALLDQHLPELGAGPPVPHDRPQRRDQHGARQRQLDARPRGAAAQRAVRRRPRQVCASRATGRLRLGGVRQRARAAGARRPLAAARDDDDDPRGLPHARRDLAGGRRASTTTRPA